MYHNYQQRQLQTKLILGKHFLSACSYPTLTEDQFALTKNKSSYAEGESFEAACRLQYTQKGSTLRYCLSTGAWSADGPTCSLFGEFRKSSHSAEPNKLISNRKSTMVGLVHRSCCWPHSDSMYSTKNTTLHMVR